MDANERKSESAEELAAEMNQDEAGRRDAEQEEQQDLNQGMQTGTHDALRHGINWGPSFRIKKSSGNTPKSQGE